MFEHKLKKQGQRMKKNYRIKDIAELSGVSTGTVDRILHKRGKVSTEAREKVEKVLKEIDYHPNLIARSLALKKQYNIIVLTPVVHNGEYWDQLCSGIEAAEKELSAIMLRSSGCILISMTETVLTA